MKLNNLDYTGSYIIAPVSLTASVSDYLTESIAEYKIYISNDVQYDHMANEHGKIVIIGYCFDIRNGQKTQNEILNSLLSSNNIIDELDYINGRYLIIRQHGSNTELFSDASQLQPLAYHRDSGVLASHDKLLAEFLKENDYMIKQREDKLHHTELDYTRYYEIYKMNPSLALNLNDFEFARIYPREPLQDNSPEESFEKMKPYLDESVKWLQNNTQEKFLTITGGIDSRVSASLTRDIPDVEYLTYLTPRKKLATSMARRIYKIDEEITRDMKRNLGWKHDIINIFDFQVSPEEYKQSLELFNSKHSFGLRNYYENHKKYKHALHIKSTVFGMGKADFNTNLDQQEDTLEFYTKCLHGLPKELMASQNFQTEIDKYFERNLVEAGMPMGRHYFDIFHLESRMGNWHSTLTLETDPQTDEFIFTNARKMIDLIQKPSVEDRRNFKLYKCIINNYWPVLLHFGINKIKNVYEQNIENNFMFKNLNIEGSSNLLMNANDHQLALKPKSAPIRFDELFTVKIKTNKDERFLLKSTYNNPKGQGNIRVIIRSNHKHNVYDITKLNSGLELTADTDGILIMMMYSRLFINPSWKDAGELLIEQL